MSYRAIAVLGRRYHKAIWCLEAGHNSSLWELSGNPWMTWENALLTARVYERTVRLSGAVLMDYWTYQDNYPLVDKNTGQPYPVFHVVRQMQPVFAPGAQIVVPSLSSKGIRVLGSIQPSSQSVAILLVNPDDEGTVTLHGLPPMGRCEVTISDRAAQERALPEEQASADGDMRVAVPARSVVTVVSVPACGRDDPERLLRCKA